MYLKAGAREWTEVGVDVVIAVAWMRVVEEVEEEEGWRGWNERD